jgi:hypothetical protein
MGVLPSRIPIPRARMLLEAMERILRQWNLKALPEPSESISYFILGARSEAKCDLIMWSDYVITFGASKE